MRVLLINTSERTGGAAVAAGRLMEALRSQGVDARMLVRDKQTRRQPVIALGHGWLSTLRFLWERFVIRVVGRPKRCDLFAIDIANTGADITSLPEFRQADVIHLHWINQGMLSLKDIGRILDFGKPVVWTMHDMWPCTGICHHARQCTAYRDCCGHCSFLGVGGSRHDLAYRTFRRKQRLYSRARIHFVACSHWLEELARSSALCQGHLVTCIPNPLDIQLFRPCDPAEARMRLGLPAGKKLLLFGSVKVTDKRKGIDYLVEACRLLAQHHPEQKDDIEVVVFGGRSAELSSLLPFKVHALSFVADEQRLVDLYNAVDLFVTPSLEENLPNIIMETMACGTPCVGFAVGGIPEMIEHLRTGYLARYRSASDLSAGIHYLLFDADADAFAARARRRAVDFYEQGLVARQYMKLYEKAILPHR